jgi:DNA-binding MarR family transcriptional regulator
MPLDPRLAMVEGGERHRLPFDPVEEAARQWAQHWAEMPRMRAVTSLMRVHQLVLTELDELLRPLGLTFARYEVLVLLAFSRRGSLPLGKIGERLQVHATSVTPLVKRLEAAELITRTPHPEDGRAVLAAITPRGRALLEEATQTIVAARFGLGSLSEEECDLLTRLLTRPRSAAGDF